MIGYEVLVAFFLEATFLGVMLFGWNRVPPWLHTLSAVVVAVGTLMSAFWILSANSWMQTPAGYEMRDGVAYPVDWLAIVFNPSFPYRLAHMVTAAYLTTSFVVLAVGARYLLAGRHLEHGRTMVRMAVGFAAIVAPLQLVIGDQHGLNTLAASAAEDRGDRGALGRQQARRARAVRLAGRERGDEPLCGRRSRTPARSSSPIAGTACFPASRACRRRTGRRSCRAFFAFRIMVGIGLLMIAGRADRRVAVVARPIVRRRDGISWPAQHAWWIGFVAVICGLDRHRDRPAALGRVRNPAHRRRRFTARRPHGGHDARAVRAGLRRRARDGHLLHQPADRAWTERTGDRTSRQRNAGTAAAAGRRGRTQCSGRGRMTDAHRERKRGGVMEWYLPVIWAAIIGLAVAMYVILDGFDLGDRHPVPVRRDRARARPDDEYGRSVLGRQRDLARPRRRRHDGRFPARLFDHHAGALPAGHRHAARAGVPRGGVRIPLARRDQQARIGRSRSRPARRSPRFARG